MRRDEQFRTRRQTSRRLTTFVPLLILMIGAAGLALTLVNARQGAQLDYLLVLSAAVFLPVGALILHRTDGNRVGWVLAATGLALVGAGATANLSDRVSGAIGGALWLSWSFSWVCSCTGSPQAGRCRRGGGGSVGWV